MSGFVLDASIVIQRFIIDTHSAQVRAFFYQIGSTVTVYLPEFCLSECVNVLWKHVRFQGMSQATAEAHTKDLLALYITLIPTVDLLPIALKIGLQHQLAVYDALYIALAEEFGYPLITDDERQARAAAAHGVTLKPITDFTP
jgi:predicted nucleic acid-binding protein